MAKLYYDDDKIIKKVIPSIEDTITSVNSVSSIGNNINIPNGFYYYNTLKRTINEIDSIKNSLNDINDWLVSSNKKINDSMEKVNSMVVNLEPIDFEIRKNIIL